MSIPDHNRNNITNIFFKQSDRYLGVLCCREMGYNIWSNDHIELDIDKVMLHVGYGVYTELIYCPFCSEKLNGEFCKDTIEAMNLKKV